MQVIFFGTPQFAVPTLQKLLDHPRFNVIGVVTQPDKRRGRGKQLIPSAVKKIALNHNIPIWQPKRIKKDQDTLSQLKNSQADAFVVVAYGQILSLEILQMPKVGAINVHGSILPQYRGAAPIQWCLYNGDRQTGITTMLMDEGMDTGDMLLKAYTDINLFENAYQIAEKLANQGADLLIETLEKLESNEIQAVPQNNEEATYASLINKDDFIVDWNKSAIAIHNQIRGFYPNCFTSFRDYKLKIMATIPMDDDYLQSLDESYQELNNQLKSLDKTIGKPGEVIGLIKNFGPVIKTGKGLLLLSEIQRSGKRPQSGWDLVNGTHLKVGELLS
ncbi:MULTISPECIES: methionyl-tRNA formyltransferase [Crocosphaera]|uniref:Methionyl-tRNA formyltransferase n=3 Tax=Crocosphaera watsonii TaxID=263511 RepID=T2JPR3_CROWT|nr:MULTISPECIES: methionyl-tRNA formyltransferase [Crocosphaera]EHJ10174.1 Methionyl-tRNA formyltransferase [Crocosphaera watsonii WH 0003]MCH2244889.1 methionyl-tRNA formyltransferase [Crocosphaera sp.]CCQ54567.1 Methionyl-tRNA formyltransferase [Crocosphaera watsonii WH 0005]CCQ66547.1 Methionyl-tRNA formyltransferase [Crocosphaera watsonii WH 0402]